MSDIKELLKKLLSKSAEKKADDFAPGIPDKNKSSNPPRAQNAIWEYVLQRHKSVLAPHHRDLRLSDGSVAYSWALPKQMPEPGEQRLAIKQPDHAPDYLDFTGKIGEGYGAGMVEQEDRSRFVKILKSHPGLVKFILMHKHNPREFLLRKFKDKKWLLRNMTPLFEKLKLDRSKYKNIKEEEFYKNYLGSDFAASPKIDGAHAIIDMEPEKMIRIFSPRQSKRTEEAIQYTYHLPNEMVVVDHGLGNTRARGELFFVDKDGKVVPSRITSGILNSSPYNALRKIKENGYKPKIYLFGLDTYKGKDVKHIPYKDKLELLRKIDKATPSDYIYPEQAIVEEAKIRLLMDIKEGKHPYSREGLVIHGLNNAATPKKLKFHELFDVYIKNVIKGKKPGEAGAFEYSFTSNGEIAGKVGTGFDKNERREMLKKPELWIDRIAKVEAQARHPSGALREPIFVGLHDDK